MKTSGRSRRFGADHRPIAAAEKCLPVFDMVDNNYQL
jgi:hypothetical protein